VATVFGDFSALAPLAGSSATTIAAEQASHAKTTLALKIVRIFNSRNRHE
jgi:hypothetical protein